MLCDVASIFVVRTLIVSQAYMMVLTLIDNTRIHIFMYSIPRIHFTCQFTDLTILIYMGHYQKMEQSRKAKRKKLIVHFFFFNGIVLLTGAYRI